MKLQSSLPNTSHHLESFLVALAAVALLLLASAPADSAGPEPGSGAATSDAFKLESIPGSTVQRLILTPKAAERLGIETDEVGEQAIVRKQMVGGRVVPPQEAPASKPPSGGFGGFGKVTAAPAPEPAEITLPNTAERWIEVTLTKGEMDRLRLDKPARVFALATRDKAGEVVSALPSGLPALEDGKRSMLKLYYKVSANDRTLKLYDRVRVELGVSGSDEKRVIIPYSAVYYDAKGDPWVYVNPKPLVFERQRIDIDGIVGNLVVVSKGPPVGTPVVTVGVPLLYGAEVVFGK